MIVKWRGRPKAGFEYPGMGTEEWMPWHSNSGMGHSLNPESLNQDGREVL